MSDCSNHKKEVAGIADMKQLAEMIGDLHYETLADFIDELALKIFKDSVKDDKAARSKLAYTLNKTSTKLTEVHFLIKEAWKISKPFMTDNQKQ